MVPQGQCMQHCLRGAVACATVFQLSRCSLHLVQVYVVKSNFFNIDYLYHRSIRGLEPCTVGWVRLHTHALLEAVGLCLSPPHTAPTGGAEARTVRTVEWERVRGSMNKSAYAIPGPVCQTAYN